MSQQLLFEQDGVRITPYIAQFGPTSYQSGLWTADVNFLAGNYRSANVEHGPDHLWTGPRPTNRCGFFGA
jgi:hypothetical protein